jgi:NTP pyrophosphatase (non-canonical NTP hydrolase)
MTTPELREVDYQLGGTTLNQFQKDAFGTAVYPGQGTPRGVEYTLLGALGEIGEIANKYKKILRTESDVYLHRQDLMDEAMDGVWYLMAFLKELGYQLQEGADFNLAKLAARKASGTLKEHK